MPSRSPLVGRQAELGRLVEALSGGLDRSGLVISGEAGIGKSRLVRAGCDTLSAQGHLVLAGWCLGLSEDVPFLPFVDVLRDLAGRDDGRLLKAAFAASPAYVLPEVARLVPEVVPDNSPSNASGVDGQGWLTQRLFGAVRQLLSTLAEVTPIAIVIEDAHWADRSSKDLLRYLLAPGHATGVPVVLTSRSGGEQDPWLQDLRNRGEVDWLALAPLDRAHTLEQVVSLGVPDEATGSAVFERSGGNPFFTEQLVAGASGSGALPDTLSELLLRRLAGLGPQATDIVRAVSIAGRPLDEGILAEVTAHPQETLSDALRMVTRRQLMVRSGSGSYQMQHALVAEATIADMSDADRHEWHLRVALALATSEDAALASDVAEHFRLAGDAASEFEWRLRSARYSDSVFAPTETAAQWRRLLELWPAAHHRRGPQYPSLVDAHLRVVAAFDRAGNGPAAAEAAAAALELLPGADPPERVRLLYNGGAWLSVTDLQGGARLLEAAVEVGSTLPASEAYVLALERLQRTYALLGAKSRVERVRLLERALISAEILHSDALVKHLVAFLAWQAMVRDDVRESLILLERALEVRVDPPDPHLESPADCILTDVLLKTGDLPRVVDVGTAALRRADLQGYPQSFYSQILLSNVLEAMREQGQIDAAAQLAEKSIADQFSADSASTHSERAAIWCAQGRLDEASEFWVAADATLKSFQGLQFPREFALARAELRLWQGWAGDVLAEALPVLEPLCDSLESQLGGGLFVLAMRACADRAVRARARRDRAGVGEAHADAARLSELVERCAKHPFEGAGIPATRPADRASWRAEHSRLQDSDASLWQAAAAAWAELGRPHREAYALWRQSEALLALPSTRSAAAPVLRAAALRAQQHQPLTEAVEELARRAHIDLTASQASGNSMPTPAPAASANGPLRKSTASTDPAFGLTAREHEVVRLLGEGYTNAQIGRTLFISTKTASVHVSNILRKMDVTSRVQAAAVAAQTGLLEPEKPRGA